MAAQFRLVSDIIADVRYRADIQGQDDRHPDANLLRFFNESAQQLRLELTNMGFEWFLKGTAPASLSTTAAATGETYSEESWPIDAARIYGLHVLVANDLWWPLSPGTLSDIRDHQRNGWRSPLWSNVGSDCPRMFALREAPLGVVTVETAGKIIIAPRPTLTKQFRIFYLQNWADAASTDRYSGHEGFIEWIVWDMTVKVAARDNDTNKTYQIAVRERTEVLRRIAAAAPRTQQVSSQVPRRADGDYHDHGGPYALP